MWLEKEEDELPDRLWGVKDEARPLAVQIWDNDPATLAEVGAKLAHEFRVSVVDINFGCPVKQVTEKAHSGSYLLRYPERVGAIVERVVRGLRTDAGDGQDSPGLHAQSINAIEVAQVVEAGRRRGADRARPHGAGFFFRLGRLGADRRDQAAPEADSADRQRRLGLRSTPVLEAFAATRSTA